MLALGVLIGLDSGPVVAASFTPAVVPQETAAYGTKLVQPSVFGHSHRAISAYCYPRNYWWFYRPYTTADENYARCMPYFHYPPEAYDKGRGGNYAPPK